MENLITLPIELGTALTLIFYVVVGFYALFSVVLYFHWMEYAVDSGVRNLSLSLYLLLTLPLLGSMGLALLYL